MLIKPFQKTQESLDQVTENIDKERWQERRETGPLATVVEYVKRVVHVRSCRCSGER